ncbi:hypothetical protein AMS68_003805 [Peltaster fructicola]|uniref:Ketoreductase domain-containing protein n=1 Tax=Peltaster fructicola TaxID=286661 RepID=A0A6H0XUJ9_9PEZI|nr:hypothetical protein AMS68_003805 [Peltaster fructicola]
MSRVLAGKTAIVTGASRGIGAAICENLAAKGCNLIMNYSASAEKTEALAKKLEKHDIKCIPVQADMGSIDGPAKVAAVADRIDIIINNAGVAGDKFIEDSDPDHFAYIMNVNVRGPLLLMKAAQSKLPHDRSGRIVNISSVSSSLGFHGQSVYGASKAALEAMTRTWARELAERATVNAVNPGPVATDMYAGTSIEFQKGMSHWTKNSPLAAIRDSDRQEFIDNAELAGGRPVSCFSLADTLLTSSGN